MQLTVFQLQQCEIQARLFESLAGRNIDAAAFIDAFLTSKVAEGLDSSYSRMQWAGAEYLYEAIVDEMGLHESSESNCHNAEALYYAGFITRYWHYLTGESSREIHAQRNARELLQSYGYHSMANELAVENMKADASRNGCSTRKGTEGTGLLMCSQNGAETNTRCKRFCEACGAQVGAEAAFCSSCGKRLKK